MEGHSQKDGKCAVDLDDGRGNWGKGYGLVKQVNNVDTDKGIAVAKVYCHGN